MTMDEIDAGIEHSTPVWAVFGDLMSGLLGAFVLILVGVLGIQLELATSLETEVQKRRIEEQRRMALEQALAAPLAAGRVTLHDGRMFEGYPDNRGSVRGELQVLTKTGEQRAFIDDIASVERG